MSIPRVILISAFFATSALAESELAPQAASVLTTHRDDSHGQQHSLGAAIPYQRMVVLIGGIVTVGTALMWGIVGKRRPVH